jgi:small subunit ribosomal protein S17
MTERETSEQAEPADATAAQPTAAQATAVQATAVQATAVQTTAAQATAAETTAAGRASRKVREGYVVSDKMDKTVVVLVEDRVKHPLYGKVLRRTRKLKAHDEQNTVGVGDRVLLMETRPLSATKRWRVVEILERAK